jgi:hypothetical protein
MRRFRFDRSTTIAGPRLASRGLLLGLLALLLAMPAALPVELAESARKGRQARAGTIFRTFTQKQDITIGNGPSIPEKSDPYPSLLRVSGFSQARITDVNLVLNDFSSEGPADLDFLLVKKDVAALVLSDAGGLDDIVQIDLTLDDEAKGTITQAGQLRSGRFKPAKFNGISNGPETSDAFPPPAPGRGRQARLDVFDGLDPNGVWQLFVIDDFTVVDVSSVGSWELRITAEPLSAQTASRKAEQRR